MRKFHCCATCIHFLAERRNEKMFYMCTRLGFETKTTYQFDCWNPKENVKKLMDKEK